MGNSILRVIMNENVFLWLLHWYRSNCNGDWEHDSRIHIDTIDNPGWSVSINFDDTPLENKIFNKIKIDRSDENWLSCFTDNNKFEGRCGPLNLPEVLQIFRDWAESCK